MNQKLRETISKNLNTKNTEELYEIWNQKDWDQTSQYTQWSREACEVARQILIERGEDSSNLDQTDTIRKTKIENILPEEIPMSQSLRPKSVIIISIIILLVGIVDLIDVLSVGKDTIIQAISDHLKNADL